MEISQYLRVDRDSPLPLAVQVAQQLRWLIVRGQVTAGERLPPVRQLGDQLGINMHTARAVYQALAKAGLVTSRPGLGTTVSAYDPERLKDSIADIPSFTIGVIVPSLEEFFTPMLDAIDDALQEEPTMLVVCNTRKLDPAKAAWFVDQLVARGTDGIILIAQDQRDPSGAPIPRIPAFPPIVVVDWPTAPDPVVFFDMEGAGHQAADHLIGHGHERIGIITPPLAPSVADAHTGIHQAFIEASLTLQPELVAHVPDWTTQSGIEGAEQLLSLSPPPAAILAFGDQLAIGVLQAAASRGLNIPTDLGLVSFGDIAVAQHLDPPLTTVRQDVAAAGAAATQMLLRLINNEPFDATRMSLPTQLIIRRSCGCPGRPNL